MAEEEKKHDVKKDLVFIASILGVLIILWFLTGGPEKVDLQHGSFFMNPSTPLQNPALYSPEVATTSPNPSY